MATPMLSACSAPLSKRCKGGVPLRFPFFTSYLIRSLESGPQSSLIPDGVKKFLNCRIYPPPFPYRQRGELGKTVILAPDRIGSNRMLTDSPFSFLSFSSSFLFLAAFITMILFHSW